MALHALHGPDAFFPTMKRRKDVKKNRLDRMDLFSSLFLLRTPYAYDRSAMSYEPPFAYSLFFSSPTYSEQLINRQNEKIPINRFSLSYVLCKFT